MSVCTFFGHRDAPAGIYLSLTESMRRLVSEGVDSFLFGHNGSFDLMAMRAFCEIRRAAPSIRGAVVLAYHPAERPVRLSYDIETVYPDELRDVPLRFAVDKRNHFMLRHADYVICYVHSPGGGAAKFRALAISSGKHVIDVPAFLS